MLLAEGVVGRVCDSALLRGEEKGLGSDEGLGHAGDYKITVLRVDGGTTR